MRSLTCRIQRRLISRRNISSEHHLGLLLLACCCCFQRRMLLLIPSHSMYRRFHPIEHQTNIQLAKKRDTLHDTTVDRAERGRKKARLMLLWREPAGIRPPWRTTCFLLITLSWYREVRVTEVRVLATTPKNALNTDRVNLCLADSSLSHTKTFDRSFFS